MIKESLYYREVFNENYKDCDKTIPYYWLPKWSGDIVEPSARILNCYENGAKSVPDEDCYEELLVNS